MGEVRCSRCHRSGDEAEVELFADKHGLPSRAAESRLRKHLESGGPEIGGMVWLCRDCQGVLRPTGLLG